jgi:hypothetical protein
VSSRFCSCLWSSSGLLQNRAAAAILPAALFCGAIFSLGATWASFVQQVLLADNDLGSHLLDGSWALPKTLEGSDVQEQIGSPISTI